MLVIASGATRITKRGINELACAILKNCNICAYICPNMLVYRTIRITVYVCVCFPTPRHVKQCGWNFLSRIINIYIAFGNYFITIKSIHIINTICGSLFQNEQLH